MPKKKSGSAAAEKPVSKTKFVLDIPANTPADEVVAKAAESGLTISKAYVYTIRANSKRAGKAKGRKRGASAPKAASTSKVATGSKAPTPRRGSIEVEFAGFIAEIGLVRAEELLRSVRAQFRAVAR